MKAFRIWPSPLGGGFDEDLFEGDAVVECFGGKFGGWRGAFGGKRLEAGGGENLLVEPNAAGLPLAGIDGFGGSLILRRYSGKVKLSANR